MKFKLLMTLVMVGMLLSSLAYSGVNLKNGNFYISYTDIVVPGGGKKLEITRTYNSKATSVGWFGFGWGSEYETTLEKSSDGSVIIREYGAGSETRFSPKTSIDPVAAANRIVTELRKRTTISDTAAADLVKKLAGNAELRHTYAQNYGLEANLADGTVLYSSDFGPQTLTVTKNGYVRTHNDGRSDLFDKDGNLVKITDKSGYSVSFTFKDGKLQSLKDSQAKQIFFDWYSNGLVKSIWSAGDKKSTFVYSGEDLVESKDVGGNTYKYTYDKSHNLTSIEYSDKTKFKIEYEPKMFFVSKITDRNGEETLYEYGENKQNPDNHYWTYVTKTGFDGKPVKNKYEYEIKHRPDGSSYTYRILTEINTIKTETIYNESSLPIKIARGNHITNFEYDKSGLLVKKNSSRGDFVNITYDEKLKKIKEVVNNDGKTVFAYDAKGNLVRATNNEGKVVTLVYDLHGKITKMVDQDKNKQSRTLAFTYNAQGKPVVIEMEKVGKINVAYDNYGEIKKVDSSAGHKMALQVTQAFQNLLSIVKPAGVNLNL